jgi:hypothetical protein
MQPTRQCLSRRIRLPPSWSPIVPSCILPPRGNEREPSLPSPPHRHNRMRHISGASPDTRVAVPAAGPVAFQPLLHPSARTTLRIRCSARFPVLALDDRRARITAFSVSRRRRRVAACRSIWVPRLLSRTGPAHASTGTARTRPSAVLMPVTAPKTAKRTPRPDHQRVHDREQEIERLLTLGAPRVDIGQTGAGSWTVLTVHKIPSSA